MNQTFSLVPTSKLNLTHPRNARFFALRILFGNQTSRADTHLVTFGHVCLCLAELSREIVAGVIHNMYNDEKEIQIGNFNIHFIILNATSCWKWEIKTYLAEISKNLKNKTNRLIIKLTEIRSFLTSENKSLI